MNDIFSCLGHIIHFLLDDAIDIVSKMFKKCKSIEELSFMSNADNVPLSIKVNIMKQHHWVYYYGLARIGVKIHLVLKIRSFHHKVKRKILKILLSREKYEIINKIVNRDIHKRRAN